MAKRPGEYAYHRLYRTRFAALFYVHRDKQLWRFCVVDTEGEHDVGTHYATRAELLADFDAYAHFYGFFE